MIDPLSSGGEHGKAVDSSDSSGLAVFHELLRDSERKRVNLGGREWEVPWDWAMGSKQRSSK